MIASRRGFLTGLGAVLCAPAIVRAESLMAIRAPTLAMGVNLGAGDATAFAVFGSESLLTITSPRGQLFTIGQITREAVQMFQNSNAFLAQLDRQYHEEFAFMSGPQWDALARPRRLGTPDA